ncbi:MAG: NAD-binding protein [Lentinula lateritia]|nr:MAG: NAD-binding protein [Lentinula lateritia]
MPSNSGPVVFITGCTVGGIGAALAEVFADRGCTVYASARSEKSMDGLQHPNIRKLLVDVTSDESVKNAVEEIYEQTGRLDVAISNAGLPGIGPLVDLPIDYIQSVMNTNFFGFARLCNYIVPRMAKSKTKGLIIPIGSILGEIGTPWTGIYNASKAALHSYAETLEMECRPLGVKVMLVAPGSIVSNIANNAAKVQFHDPPPESLYKSFYSSIRFVMFQSQTKEYGAMPTRDFATQLTDYIVTQGGQLVTNPVKYVSMGGSTWVYMALKWLPRQWSYDMIWNGLSKK